MASVDITTYSDADFTLTQNTPLPVTTNPLHMQVRTKADDKTVWLELTTANGRLVVAAGPPETLTINIPQPSLETLPAGNYVFSIIMSSFSGTKRTEVFRGTQIHIVGPTLWAAGTL